LKKIFSFLITFCLLLSFKSALLAQENQLNIYTYESFTSEWGPGPSIENEFESFCNCNLNFVSIDSSAGILSRIKLEESNAKGDIALGLDLNLLADAIETGLFAKHKIYPENLNLPFKWNNEYFLPFDYGYFAFIYNQNEVSDAPGSFKELISNQNNLKIIIQDPRTSTPGLGLMLWIKSVYGEEAGKVWEQLKKKIVTVTKSWSESYGLFLNGEADMVLSYTTSPAYHMIAEGNNDYYAANFSEGHYIQVEVAGILKNSENKSLARKFLSFMISEKFQKTIPTGNWMYPIIELNEKLPEEFNKLIIPNKTLLQDSESISKNKKKWINEWLTSMTK